MSATHTQKAGVMAKLGERIVSSKGIFHNSGISPSTVHNIVKRLWDSREIGVKTTAEFQFNSVYFYSIKS